MKSPNIIIIIIYKDTNIKVNDFNGSYSMGKRHCKWSYRTYLRFLKNGRGSGELCNYKPWITTHDFPSKGKVVRILGRKTHRIHHLLSQYEKIYFLMLDYDPLVEDIKEQYPIPLYMSQLLAAKLGIRHPCVNGFSYVMTTDFMFKREGVWHAVQIKPQAETEKARVQEKFAIEKAYYEKIGVDWQVVTEESLPRHISENYIWLTSGEALTRLVPNSDKLKKMKSAFLELYADYSIPFQTILSAMDEMCAVAKGTTMQLFKSCIQDESIKLNLAEELFLTEPRTPENCLKRNIVC